MSLILVVTMMGGWPISSPLLSSVSMSAEFSGVKNFRVGTDVTVWDLGGLFSPVMFLFFRFLSWNPSVSTADASVGLFVWEDSVALPTLFWSAAFRLASVRQ